MNLFTGIAIYLTLWWTVLFAVLPLGSQSHAEAGIKPLAEGDPPGVNQADRPSFPQLWQDRDYSSQA